MPRRLILALSFLILWSCTADFAPEEGVSGAYDELEAAKATTADGMDPNILPAYALPWEHREPGKEDLASDFHKAHPQWYNITEPPSGAFRPMMEWEPMQSLVLAYSDYVPGNEELAGTMLDIVVNSLDAGEVWVVHNTDGAKNDLISRVQNAGVSQSDINDKIRWFPMDNDAIWFIDFGPFPIVREGDDPSVAFADFRYYYDRVYDDAIPTRLGSAVGATTYRSPFDFEGGNFQADGEKYCYFSERVYTYTGMTFEQVQTVMQDYYGCKEAVVLKDITNDGTGHIDMFFKLAGRDTAILGEYTVVVDATNEARMDENQAILESLSYEDGSGITVYRLPFPNASTGFGETIPRTYINSTLFVSADESVKLNLWPMYSVDKDLEAEALAVWQEAMPDWEHVGIESDEISTYSGAVHCVTRTIPALPIEKWVADGQCLNGACQGDGYDGACLGGSEPTPGCWGPKWECLCNDCTLASCQVPASCGDGTCGPGEDCYTCIEDCGCGTDELCNFVTRKCSIDRCGNGTCDEEENCMSCDADCGCTGGTVCSMGVCAEDPCGGVGYEGCCDGSVSVYCEEGGLIRTDCGSSTCGWVSDKGWYDCGGSGQDGSGTFPLDCGGYNYPVGCAGKVCGDNGAGYSCGECDAGQVCNHGQCSACDPVCDGLECGDDGCGGSCGECAEGSVCNAGVCGEPCVPVCDGVECGDDGCGGSCGECAEGLICNAGVCGEPCVPACDGMECGDDGCGGTCGTCEDGFSCDTGLCVEECVPVCDGLTCGDDGCGGTCGTCGDGEMCDADGQCVVEPAPDAGESSGCTVASQGGASTNAAGSALLFLSLVLGLGVLRRTGLAGFTS